MSTDVFAVIADPTRRRILQVLHAGPHAVNDVVTELGVSQPTVSKHLRVLREADLVSMRAEGQRRYYALHAQPLETVARWIAELEQAPVEAPVEVASPQGVETAERAETSQEPADPEVSEAREDVEAPAEPISPEPATSQPVPESPAEHLPESAEEPATLPSSDTPAETAEQRTVRRRRSGVVFHPLTPTRAAQETAAPAETGSVVEAPTSHESREEVPGSSSQIPAAHDPGTEGAEAEGPEAGGHDAESVAAEVPVPEDPAFEETTAEPEPVPSPRPAPTPPASLDPHVQRQPEDSRRAAETKPGGILASLFGRKRGR